MKPMAECAKGVTMIARGQRGSPEETLNKGVRSCRKRGEYLPNSEARVDFHVKTREERSSKKKGV